MNTDQRLRRLERSLWVWRGVAVALLGLGLMGVVGSEDEDWGEVLSCNQLIVSDPVTGRRITIGHHGEGEDRESSIMFLDPFDLEDDSSVPDVRIALRVLSFGEVIMVGEKARIVGDGVIPVLDDSTP